MGTQKTGKLWINTKKEARRRRNINCMDEMLSLMACFKKCNYEDEAKCAGEKLRLDQCLEHYAGQPKQKNTINFHLQRLDNASRR